MSAVEYLTLYTCDTRGTLCTHYTTTQVVSAYHTFACIHILRRNCEITTEILGIMTWVYITI